MIARLIEEIRLEIVGRFNRAVAIDRFSLTTFRYFYEISKINVQSFFLIQLFIQSFIILVLESNVSCATKRKKFFNKSHLIMKRLNRVTGNYPRGICIYTIDFSSKLEEVYSSEGKESIHRLPGERSWSSSLARVPL